MTLTAAHQRELRIERKLAAVERQLREDLTATAPGQVADPAVVRRTIDEVLIGVRRRLDATEP